MAGTWLSPFNGADTSRWVVAPLASGPPALEPEAAAP